MIGPLSPAQYQRKAKFPVVGMDKGPNGPIWGYFSPKKFLSKNPATTPQIALRVFFGLRISKILCAKHKKKFGSRFDKVASTRPDLSGWAGRVDSRDRAVGCAAQEIFMMALRAAGRRVMNTGVHPRHFSSGFYLGVRACVRVCKRCETTARGARWDKKAGLPPLPSLLHLEIPGRSPERLRCRARVCRVGGRRQL